MLVQNLAFLITFIITTGIATIGVLGTFNLFQEHKKPVLQILLYQQIFLFSFFIYSIWGNIAIRELISDLNLAAELNYKLALFIPVLGAPFLIVSWFMLLKFGFNLNGKNISKVFAWGYFIFFLAGLIMFSYLVQNRIIKIPAETDLFIARLLVFLNLAVHLALAFPFFTTQKPAIRKDVKIHFRKTIGIYFLGVLLYSVMFYFFNFYGFISTCLSILMLFGINIIIPVSLRMKPVFPLKESHPKDNSFTAFCEQYEISKREAEIILEICSGKTNKAISEKLFITLQTVKDHNHRIYTKTQVKTRVQLANLVRAKIGGADLAKKKS